MDLTTLKALIAGYLKKTSLADFEVLNADTLQEAINSAIRSAQRKHDFRFSEVTADLIITSSGGLMSAATISAAAVSLKRIKNVLLPIAGGDYLPVEFMSYEDLIKRIQRETGRQAYSPTSTLASLGVSTLNPIAYQQGQTIRLYPAASFTFPITVHLDAIQFLPDLAADADTNFFLEYAPEYLQWQGILELNKWWKEYVTRQEGAVEEGSVQAFAAEAYANLIAWDLSLTAGTSNPPPPQQ